MNWTLVGDILPRAVGVAISPLPIVLVILIMVSKRARINGPTYALGIVLGIFGLAFAAYALADAANLDSQDGPSTSAAIIQTLLGVLLLALAFQQWRRRPKPGEEPQLPSLFRTADTMAPLTAFGMGLLFAAVNPKNTPIGLGVGVQIAQEGLALTPAAITAGIYALIGASSVLIPVVLAAVLGDRISEQLESTRRWLILNNATILTVVFAMLGVRNLGIGLSLLD